jgi:epoxyqueuosine reductase
MVKKLGEVGLMPIKISERIRSICEEFCRANELAFLGIVDLEVSNQDAKWFKQWLGDGKQADMSFLEHNQELRIEPKKLFDGAKTAVMFAFPYGRVQAPGQKPRIAEYAKFQDYHKILKSYGTSLANQLASELGLEFTWRVFTDSAPILERALAKKTRSGFIGKNTCYIHPEKGSFLLLAELFIALPNVYPDKPAAVDARKRSAAGGCGSCKRCQVFCPTGALDEDYKLDARRCLAYWTIEHRGTIPFEFWPHLKTYWFGCDICQNVCPYNRGVGHNSEENKHRKKHLDHIDLLDVASMNQATYEQLFGGSPMTRAKITGLRRNALIALAVTQDERLETYLPIASKDPSSLIRDTAAQIMAYNEGIS